MYSFGYINIYPGLGYLSFEPIVIYKNLISMGPIFTKLVTFTENIQKKEEEKISLHRLMRVLLLALLNIYVFFLD